MNLMVYKIVESNDHRKVALDWLRKEDLPEVVETLNSVIREGKFLFLNNEITDMDMELQWFERAMREGMCYLVGRVNRKVVGGASIHPQMDKHAHIASYGIFIHKDCRDVGLGTILTTEMIETAKERGLEILQLSVYASNKRAKHVYEKCGFKEIGRLTRGIKYPDGTYTDEILMELLLK
jgi:ribosomal protein S18 acetylase RimI-like enzyme